LWLRIKSITDFLRLLDHDMGRGEKLRIMILTLLVTQSEWVDFVPLAGLPRQDSPKSYEHIMTSFLRPEKGRAP
jgi:hypothetical protein